MIKLKDGVNLDISNSDYHAEGNYVSSSGLKLILDDEIEFVKKYFLKEKKQQPEDAFAFGTYIHALLLEPHLVKENLKIFQGARRFGKAWDDFQAENKDKLIVTPNELMAGAKIEFAYRQHKIAKGLLSDGEAEKTFCHTLKNGLGLKVRPDFVGQGYIVDVKTTSEKLNNDTLAAVVARYAYDLSAAMYLDVVNKCQKEKVNDFYFLFIGKTTSEIMVLKASPELIKRGREKYKEAANKYKELRDSGYFQITDFTELQRKKTQERKELLQNKIFVL